MHPDSRKYLHDIKHSTDLVADFCSTASYETYSSNALLKPAVERQFCIIGEALSQLARIDAETADRFPDRRHVIAFRNILVHGYANVDDKIV